jgi:hypothetical protein
MSKWIARPISILRRAQDRILIRDSLSGFIKEIRRDDLSLLMQLGAFRTKEGHAQHYYRNRFNRVLARICTICSSLGLSKLARILRTSVYAQDENQTTISPSISRRLIAHIDRLESAGLLISQSQFKDFPVRNSELLKIEFVVVPTCHRPANLAVLLEGLLSNRRAFGKQYTVMVSDDSEDGSATETSKECARVISKSFGIGIQFTSRSKRKALVMRLERLGFHGPTLDFALLATGETGNRYGANRNSQALLTNGCSYVSCDDDILLPAQSTSEHLSMTFVEEDPFYVSPLLKQEDNVKDHAHVDFVGQHELHLGRSLSELLEPSEEMSHPCSHAIIDLVNDSGQVLLTSSGVVGDSGMSSGSGIMLSRNRRLQYRLAADNDFYKSLRVNRGITRTVDQFTVTHHFYPMTMCFAVYGSVSIPFFPAYRQEDLIFSILFNKIFPHGYSIAVPFNVGHHPAASRPGYDCWMNEKRTLRLGDCFVALINYFSRPSSLPLSQETIGSWLSYLGTLPLRDFTALCNDAICKSLVEESEFLTKLIDEYRFLASVWREDLIKRQLTNSEVLLRSDQLRHLEVRVCGDESNTITFQRMISRYGGMLSTWTILKDTIYKEVDCTEFVECL